MLDYARGDAIPMDDVRRQLPFSMTSVRDFAKAYVKLGAQIQRRTAVVGASARCSQASIP